MNKGFIMLFILAAALASGCTSMKDAPTGEDQDIQISETQAMYGDDVAQNGEESYEAIFSSVENTAKYNLIELAKTDPNLTTFMQLIEQAGMEEELSQGEPYTLFIPANKAFSELSEDSLQNLMLPENKAQLIRILQTHIMAGIVPTSSLADSTHLESMAGDYLLVEDTSTPSTLIIGGATLVKPNVRAANGIIHVINKILLTSEGVGRY